MSQFVLNVETRADLGKQSAKKFRREGRVPGIYYMHGEDSVPFTIDAKELYNALHTETSILDLKFDNGEPTKCVVRDIQWHPISDTPMHIDLMGIKMTEKVQVEVSVHFVGQAVGVKRDGGVVQQVMRELSIESLPADIPEHVEVDISELEIGDTIKVESLQLEDVRILNDPTQTLVVIQPPRVIEEITVEEEEELAEPGLVGEDEEEAAEDEKESEEE